MSDYMNLLHEIEEKKLGLEVRLADVIATEISKFHKEHGLPVKAVYVSLENVSAIDEPKNYVVSSAEVDLDYKP